MNLLTIGSVIKVNGIDLIILGYHMAEEEEAYKFYYIVGLFPVGYMPGQEKSMGFLAIDHEYELLAKGHSNKYSDNYLKKYEERITALKDMNPKAINAILAEAAKRMEESNE